MDVCATETVNRLLGVTDQQQRRVLPVFSDAVDGIEQLQLQRRGVLKFVHQRHRELRAQTLGQALAVVRPRQRRGQALQHVGKAKLRVAAFEFGQAGLHGGTGMQPCCGFEFGQLLQALQQVGVFGAHGRQVQRPGIGFAAIAQALGREAVPRRFPHQGLEFRQGTGALRPLLQALQPFGAPHRLQLAAVPSRAVLQLAQQPVQQGLRFLRPARLELLQPRFALGLHAVQGLRQRAGRGGGQFLVDQVTDVGVQRRHILPDLSHLRHSRRVQRVQLLAPIVLHGLQPQPGFVGDQAFLEQAAAVKGVLAQHALAPGVDRVDGRFVHGLRGQRQAVGGLLACGAFGVFGQQFLHEIFFRRHAAPKHLRRLGQPGADAVRQLARRGAGEGHHQNVRRHERTHRPRVVTAVTQHQPHIQGRNRPGLAGARAGLDQVAAAQRKTAHMKGLCAHSSSPPVGSAKGSPVHCAAQASSGAYTRSASVSKRPSASKASSVG